MSYTPDQDALATQAALSPRVARGLAIGTTALLFLAAALWFGRSDYPQSRVDAFAALGASGVGVMIVADLAFIFLAAASVRLLGGARVPILLLLVGPAMVILAGLFGALLDYREAQEALVTMHEAYRQDAEIHLMALVLVPWVLSLVFAPALLVASALVLLLRALSTPAPSKAVNGLILGGIGAVTIVAVTRFGPWETGSQTAYLLLLALAIVAVIALSAVRTPPRGTEAHRRLQSDLWAVGGMSAMAVFLVAAGAQLEAVSSTLIGLAGAAPDQRAAMTSFLVTHLVAEQSLVLALPLQSAILVLTGVALFLRGAPTTGIRTRLPVATACVLLLALPAAPSLFIPQRVLEAGKAATEPPTASESWRYPDVVQMPERAFPRGLSCCPETHSITIARTADGAWIDRDPVEPAALGQRARAAIEAMRHGAHGVDASNFRPIVFLALDRSLTGQTLADLEEMVQREVGAALDGMEGPIWVALLVEALSDYHPGVVRFAVMRSEDLKDFEEPLAPTVEREDLGSITVADLVARARVEEDFASAVIVLP